MMHEVVEKKNGELQVISYDVHLNKEEKMERIILHEMITDDAEDIIDYLISMDVPEEDAIQAFDSFEELGHNKASFGVTGGLIFTSFEGVLQ